MKRFALFALAMLVALFPVIAIAEEAGGVPAEEVWSATVLRVDAGSLLLRIEAVDPQDEAAYPWDEAPEASPAPQESGETPKAHSLSSEDAPEDGDAIGVQVVDIAEDTPVWRRVEDGFEEAAVRDIAEGDLLTLRVADGAALEVVIEQSDPDAGAAKSWGAKRGSGRDGRSLFLLRRAAGNALPSAAQPYSAARRNGSVSAWKIASQEVALEGYSLRAAKGAAPAVVFVCPVPGVRIVSEFHFHAVVGGEPALGAAGQGFVGQAAVVAEVAAYAQRALVYAAQFGKFGEKALRVRDAHVVVRAAFKAHGRVDADQIVAPGGEQFPGRVAQAKARIVGVEQRFAVLFADVDEAFLEPVVVGGHGGDLPAAAAHALAAMDGVELHELADGLGAVKRGGKVSLETAPHGFVAVDVQHARRALLVGAVAVDEAGGEPMVHVVVGHEQGVDAAEAQIVRQSVIVGVRRKVDEQFAVDEHLRARAHFPPPPGAGVFADRAGAEGRGQALRRRGAEIEYLHNVSS